MSGEISPDPPIFSNLQGRPLGESVEFCGGGGGIAMVWRRDLAEFESIHLNVDEMSRSG